MSDQTTSAAEDAPGEAFQVPIELGKIREFAKATQSENPAYFQPGAVIPPTFLISPTSFWAPASGSMPNIGFDLRRLLHGEQEYVFHGPAPRAGQTLTAQAKIAERYEKEGKRGGTMRFAVLVTEFRDAEGNLVAEQRSTLVETARPPKEA